MRVGEAWGPRHFLLVGPVLKERVCLKYILTAPETRKHKSREVKIALDSVLFLGLSA